MEMSCEKLHGELLVTLDPLLRPDECAGLIARGDAAGWKKSSVSGGGHGRTGREDARTNEFCVLHDTQFAQLLWERVRAHVLPDLTHIPFNTYLNTETRGKEWSAVGVVDKLRLYKYSPGEEFPEHVDYKTGRDIVRGGKRYRQQTFITLLVYLNEDFDGGTTNYWVNHEGIHCRFLRDVEDKPPSHRIQPVTGRAVLQEQNLLHEGSAPTRGTKYVLRTDILHERERPLHPRLAARAEYSDEKDRVGEWERIFETSCKNYAD